MNVNETDRLMREINDLENQLIAKKFMLEKQRSDCEHNWGPTQFAPIIQKAYTIPGDESGTMGSDWHGEQHVPSQTTKMWKRTCVNCGLSQTTQNVESVIAPGKIH